MFEKKRFGTATNWLDSIQIWGSSLLAVIGGVASLFEGRGMAMSLLIAVGILPLAFLTIVLIRNHKRIRVAVGKFFSAPAGGENDYKTFMYDPADEAPNQETYFRLMDFVIDYLLPACDAQIALQKEIVKSLSNNPKITDLAIRGLQFAPYYETGEFWKNYDVIVRGIDSSEPTIRFSAVVEHIRGLERGSYKTFCSQADDLAASANLDIRSDETLAPLWETWRSRHNALVEKYDDIKRQVRFGKLFYPRRESRWGAPIPPTQERPS